MVHNVSRLSRLLPVILRPMHGARPALPGMPRSSKKADQGAGHRVREEDVPQNQQLHEFGGDDGSMENHRWGAKHRCSNRMLEESLTPREFQVLADAGLRFAQSLGESRGILPLHCSQKDFRTLRNMVPRRFGVALAMCGKTKTSADSGNRRRQR